MELNREFNIELISKSLNEIQAEKGRNERLLQTEMGRRVNSEFELQTAVQKRKDTEKKHLEMMKELATLKNRCIVVDRQFDDLMEEHNKHREEIEVMTSEENTNEIEHKQTMGVHYKILDGILAKFRNTKSVLMSEFQKDSDLREVEADLGFLETEFENKKIAIEEVQSSIADYEKRSEIFREKEELLKEDYANIEFLQNYFRKEMEASEKQCDILTETNRAAIES